jgi:hypothetical protein
MVNNKCKNIKIFGILVFLLIMLTNCVVATPIQYKTTDGGNDHWYDAIYVSTGNTWDYAKTSAVKTIDINGIQYTGYLATITSQGENDFIKSVVNTVSTYSSAYWIGGFQTSGVTAPSEGWNWLPNDAWTSSSYNNWASSEPNDLNGAVEEDRLTFYPNGKWNDDENSNTAIHGYIVEYELTNTTSVPEFPSVAVPVAAILGLMVIFGRKKEI